MIERRCPCCECLTEVQYLNEDGVCFMCRPPAGWLLNATQSVLVAALSEPSPSDESQAVES